MSRRFGRNQKRRMRAELAAEHDRLLGVQRDNCLFQQTLREQRGELENISQFYTEILRRLPEQSLFKPLTRMERAEAHYPYLHIHRDWRGRFEAPSDHAMREEMVQVERVPLVEIQTLIEKNIESFRYDIWFLATSPEADCNRSYRLCITRRALEDPTRNLKEALLRLMSDQMDEKLFGRRA